MLLSDSKKVYFPNSLWKIPTFNFFVDEQKTAKDNSLKIG